ncbi:hypothetical protein WJ978_19770 [Achromobacter xylosoxidans]
MTVPVAFQGEVMLAGWSQTHNGGAKVTFWLQDDTDLEAFKAMTVAKGKTAGQRLALVAVEIGDDEQPVVSREQGATALCLKNAQILETSLRLKRCRGWPFSSARTSTSWNSFPPAMSGLPGIGFASSAASLAAAT